MSMDDEFDPLQDALRLIEKLNAELSGVSFIVAEMLGAELKQAPNPRARLDELAKAIQPRLEMLPDEGPQDWARQRVELVFSHAQDVPLRREPK